MPEEYSGFRNCPECGGYEANCICTEEEIEEGVSTEILGRRLRIRMPSPFRDDTPEELPVYRCANCGMDRDRTGCVCEDEPISAPRQTATRSSRTWMSNPVAVPCSPEPELIRYTRETLSGETITYQGVEQPVWGSEPIYKLPPKHERTLTKSCDNSCGAVMCIVCMENLDYYLDF